MKLDFKDIYIRPLEIADINDRYINWFSDSNVIEFLEVSHITKEDSKLYLINGYKTGTYYIYAICLNKNNLHIGNVKIGPIKRKEGVSDLVTVVGDKKYWGKGVARIAIFKAIELGFEEGNIRKFVASINSLNLGSIKAYLKAGFKKEAIIKNYFYNKIDKNIVLSDKVFVSCENKKFNMKVLEIWKPFTTKDINLNEK